MVHNVLIQLRAILAFGLLATISIAPLAARKRMEDPRETISIRVSEGTTL
jgi:hypothetical protein